MLADERVGAEPQQRQVERLRDPPRVAGEERVGRRPVHDRVAVGAPAAPSAGRRTPASTERRRRGPRPRARAWRVRPRLRAATDRRRRRPIGSSPPGPTRARRRRCARRTSSVERRARSTCSSASRSTPSTVRWLGLRGEPAEVGAVVRDDELERHGRRTARRPLRRAEAGSHQFDARHGRVVAGTRAELQDAQVAAAAVARSAARSRRTACA